MLSIKMMSIVSSLKSWEISNSRTLLITFHPLAGIIYIFSVIRKCVITNQSLPQLKIKPDINFFTLDLLLWAETRNSFRSYTLHRRLFFVHYIIARVVINLTWVAQRVLVRNVIAVVNRKFEFRAEGSVPKTFNW